jgi:hypothetical protein
VTSNKIIACDMHIAASVSPLLWAIARRATPCLFTASECGLAP